VKLPLSQGKQQAVWLAGASFGAPSGVGTGRRLGRGEAHVKCQESDTLPSTMKKKVCVILGAGVSAGPEGGPSGELACW
jgi:hypothetical protein